MARILRGEIRWANLNLVKGRQQGGNRPVVIISQDVFNERSGTVIAMAITSQPQRAGFPLTLELSSRYCQNNHGSRSVRSERYRVERIGDVINRLTPEQMERLIEGLDEIVGG